MQRIALGDGFSSPSPPSSSSAAYSSPLERIGGGAELGIRMNYTMAITRFVNSIVDSYQSGNFAQSIAAIAARIGLPHWFVELRHAGTHEDLPSLTVCREATRAALEWLHRNFWAPTLFAQQNGRDENAAPSTSSEVASTIVQVRAAPSDEQQRKERSDALEQIRTLVKSYKKLGKAIVRDNSLAGRQRADVVRLFKGIYSWTTSRMMVAGAPSKLIASRMGRKRTREEIEDESAWADDTNGYDAELVRAANKDLIDALLKPGGIVPLSKAKRVRASAQADAIVLPSELEETWSPLIAYLRANLGLPFLTVLFEELIASLAYSAPETPESASDGSSSRAEGEDEDWRRDAWIQPTYKKTAEAWLRHLIVVDGQMMGEDVTEIHRGAAKTLEMAVIEQCLRLPAEGTISLLRLVGSLSDRLSAAIAPLLPVLESSVSLGVSDLFAKAETAEAEVRTASAEAGDDSGAAPSAAAAAAESASATAASASDAEGAQAVAVEVAPSDDTGAGDGADAQAVAETGFEGELAEMEARLEQLHRSSADAERHGTRALLTGAAGSGGDGNDGGDAAAAVAAMSELPAGWARAGPRWTPTPIGCLEGRVPALSLAF
ncbi:uncharacterized protein PFL1_06356 [Pseudozyma flocculosa PF-1]|uniref:Las1-domain-containing protein n=2 Tax=Pseudozyma flocculosa TaxID=84751 RepID=A0A5C3F8K7_9BASI|nr:uncharacterized protein PFL1_06356 [Pseudozyma flocculosa PF-1]EPQ26148.1 hypothetical protein PFL1_06356 [Pseudozyma flocculosa PF-1]SPO40396.1 uncharacterized protein PSFLO_05878 [Pseudozyma flocculosa]